MEDLLVTRLDISHFLIIMERVQLISLWRPKNYSMTLKISKYTHLLRYQIIA
jgi:hypothetical protein